MQLNHDDIQEFKEIYRQEFGEQLSDVEAGQRARQLLTFYETILRVLVRRRTAASCGSLPVDSCGDDAIVDGASPRSGSIVNPAISGDIAAATPPQSDPDQPSSP